MFGSNILSRRLLRRLRGSLVALISCGGGVLFLAFPIAAEASPAVPAEATLAADLVVSAQWNDPLLSQYSFTVPASYLEDESVFVYSASANDVPVVRSVMRRVPPVDGPLSVASSRAPLLVPDRQGRWAPLPAPAGQAVFPQAPYGQNADGQNADGQNGYGQNVSQAMPEDDPRGGPLGVWQTPAASPYLPDRLQANQTVLQAAEQKAGECVQRGISLGQRGAVMAANAEFRQALRLVAQSRDVVYGSRSYGVALTEGLQAMKEAEDFVARGRNLDVDVDLMHVVMGHRTPILKGTDLSVWTAVDASGEYHAFAQQRLAAACGNSPMASQALFGMGKLQMALCEQTSTADSLHTPKAIVLHQAALAVDPNNCRAANELGVMLARNGQWDAACQALRHSAALQPQPEVWKNLAVVHERLGQMDLAARASREYEIAMSQRQAAPPQVSESAHGTVQWVDAATFQRVGGQAAPAPSAGPRVAERPVSRPTGWR